MSFNDRTDAGRRLASALMQYANRQPVILAIPRSGVPVAAEVAAVLHAPLDLILVRKIGVPFRPELAMGAIVSGGKAIVVRNELVIRLAGVQFKAACESEFTELERRRRTYLGSRERIEVAGSTAIVVDDGLATGATTRAALRATRMRNPRRLVLAVPVGPSENLASMRGEADELVCLEEHAAFRAIGLYYSDFRQVSDEQVIELLARFPVTKRERVSQPVT
jgi:predicted phosphoribosyltransferase